MKAEAQKNGALAQGERARRELKQKEKFILKNTELYHQAVERYQKQRDGVRCGVFNDKLPSIWDVEGELAQSQELLARRRKKYEQAPRLNKAQKMWICSAENSIKKKQNLVNACRQHNSDVNDSLNLIGNEIEALGVADQDLRGIIENTPALNAVDGARA